MKVLVTGPDGLLGSNLIRELLNKGYVVIHCAEDLKMANPNINPKKIFRFIISIF